MDNIKGFTKLEYIKIDDEPAKESKVKKYKRECKNFTFSLPLDFLAIIEEKIQTRPGISRTGWILEAIQEKIKRE